MFSKNRMRGLFQDFEANRGRPQIQIGLMLFRAAQEIRGEGSKVRMVAAGPVSILYRLYALFSLGIDIPVSTLIGPGFAINHGVGLVIHNRALIGKDVTVRQGVTIGSKAGSDAPVLGDGVDVGSGAQVIGPVNVGASAVIGAGAIVTKDVSAGDTVVGNPAKPIPRKPARPE